MSGSVSSTDALPLDVYNLASIWVETLLYGANLVLYGLTMWVLLSRHIGGRRQCPLFATSTFLFIAGSLHAWTSLAQILQAFTSPSAHASGSFSIDYWLNVTDPKAQLKGYTAVLANVEQNMVLIWRLLVVSGNWRWAIAPYAIEVAHLIVGCYATRMFDLGRERLGHDLFIAQWSISFTVNILATSFIVVRLYRIANSPNRFSLTFSTEFERQREGWLKPIFTIVESGALYTTCNIVILAMYARNDPRVQAVVGVSVQIAVFCPLLILVRVGFGITHGLGSLKGSNGTNRGTCGGDSVLVSARGPARPTSTGISHISFLSTSGTNSTSLATASQGDIESQYAMKTLELPGDVKKPVFVN